MLTRLQFTLGFLFLFLYSFSQIPQEKELIQKFSVARDDESRINILGRLAELYSIFRENEKADSILGKQLLLAEVSQNETLIASTIASNSISNIATWSSKESFARAEVFLRKGLEYAIEQNNHRLEAIVYIKLSGLLLKMKLYDQAMEQITLAFSTVNKKEDSLKAALYLELGNVFLGKGDAVSAYKNFNSAYDISYTINNIPLQSAAWKRFAFLYQFLGDSLLAKNALLESLRLNIKNNRPDGLSADYISLFRQTDEIEFLKKAMFYADSIQSVQDQLYCKRLMFSYIMVVEKNSDKALAYLKQNPDLNLYILNEGLPNFNIGVIYHYCGQYAKAINYYMMDESTILETYDPSIQLSFYNEIADCYDKLNNDDKALEYYGKAYKLSSASGSANLNASITLKLSQLFARNNDFNKAYQFSQLYQNYGEEVKKLTRQKEVALLGLEREKKRHEKDLQNIAAEELRQRNLQYTGISMATAFLFIVLLVTGMFPVSKAAIRMLNFVSFICLFEFIILLIDGWLHDITHGAPLKIWLAKIFVIALLLPLHHFLEHIAITFLSSQKLIKFREKLSFKKMWHPSKKTVERIEKNLEESTLV